MWRAILILPFNAAITVPAALLWLTRPVRPAGPGDIGLWIGLACLAAGLMLFVSTVLLFTRVGKGTLAPWDPPKRFVVEGPYRHFRHPMIAGVLLAICGEALVFRSWAVGAWAAAFFAINAVYLPLKEEPDLVTRFGQSYRDYMAHVPRWLPRLKPWRPD